MTSDEVINRAIIAQRPQFFSTTDAVFVVEFKFNGEWFGYGEYISRYEVVGDAVAVAVRAAEERGSDNVRIRIERTEVLQGWR